MKTSARWFRKIGGDSRGQAIVGRRARWLSEGEGVQRPDSNFDSARTDETDVKKEKDVCSIH